MAERLYVGKNNEIKRTFKEDGSAKDMSGATKITLEIFDTAGTTVASWNTVDHASLFTTSDLSNGNITFQPGASTITSAMVGDHKARLITVTASEPQGVVWPAFDIIISA